MKLIGIIAISLFCIIGFAQIYTSMSSSSIEEYDYEVLKTYELFEIRKYKAALFSTVELDASTYGESSNKGFRQLAGYIFGDNETEQKIAMTSPVAMQMDSTTKMMFMVPSNISQENLPKPNNPNIKFELHGPKIMAAIRFGGWANDDKIAKYQAILSDELQIEGISMKGKFMYFGYNPPYEFINRRNEVLVDVEFAETANTDKSSDS